MTWSPSEVLVIYYWVAVIKAANCRSHKSQWSPGVYDRLLQGKPELSFFLWRKAWTHCWFIQWVKVCAKEYLLLFVKLGLDFICKGRHRRLNVIEVFTLTLAAHSNVMWLDRNLGVTRLITNLTTVTCVVCFPAFLLFSKCFFCSN